MGENGLELTWEERREQRRQRRNVLSESDRCIPNDNDITERKLKAQKRTEECKRENAKFEKQLKEEDEARIQRQKKREQKREFDSDYIQKVNEDLMSRITAAPSPDFTEPPRRRRSVVTRRSRGSIRKERSVSNGDDIQRSVSDYNDVNSTFSSASRTSKVRGDSNSSNSMVSTNGLQLELSGNPKTMTDRLPSDTDVVDMLHIRSTKMNADVQFDNETAVKKNVEEATDENFNGTTKMEIELPQGSLCSGGSGRSSPAVREDSTYAKDTTGHQSVDTQAARWEKHRERRSSNRHKKKVITDAVTVLNTATPPVIPPKPVLNNDQTEDIATRLRRRLDEKAQKKKQPNVDETVSPPTIDEIAASPTIDEIVSPTTIVKTVDVTKEISKVSVVSTPEIPKPHTEDVIDSDPNSDSGISYNSGTSDRADLTPLNFNLREIDELDDLAHDISQPSDELISVNNQSTSDHATDICSNKFNDEIDDDSINQIDPQSAADAADCETKTDEIHSDLAAPTENKICSVDIQVQSITCMSSVPLSENAPSVTNLIAEPVIAESVIAEPVQCYVTKTSEIVETETPRTKAISDHYHNESYHEAETMIADDNDIYTNLDLQNSSQEIESNETNITDTTSNDLPTKTADISESEPTNIYQEEVEEIIVAERITEPKIEPTPEASGNDYKKNDDHAIEPTPTAKPTPTTKPESDEEVASVNGRVNVHQTGPSDVSKYEEPPIEKPVGKISSIDKYKQNYMKKADAPMSGNSTPNSEVTMTPPGTMSLRERMKMFEKKGNPDRIHPRETVTQSERASNIRNKISLWGKSDSGGNSLANQREKIHVGSIDERRNQYSTLAKI